LYDAEANAIFPQMIWNQEYSMGRTMKRNVAILLGFCLIGAPSAALAADMPVKAAAGAVVVAPIDYGNLYFGTDVNTKGGLVGYGGILYAPGGLGISGLRLAAFGQYGRYQYSNEPFGTTTFKGRFASFDMLAGYSHVVQNGAVTLAVGANYQDHGVTPFDFNNSVQGERWGFKVQGDFWVNPTQQTLVLGIASYSTAFDTYYSIVKFGYDVFNLGFFIGPEFAALGNDRTDQQRVGVHLTNLRIANRVTLAVSGGWLRQRNERDGAYTTASIDFTF
jgi:Cellulose biosynthesis protein BcsS